MTTAGWLIMLISVGAVSLLFGWCLFRVLFRRPPLDHLHGLNIEPPDVKED